jgi:hypothetical protein
MPSLTDCIDDRFVGTYHIPIDPETNLVPTGYTPEELSEMSGNLGKINTQINFERLKDADGTKLAISLRFNTPIEGFYYLDHSYRLTEAASGLSVVCRSIVEITMIDKHESLSPLGDREFYAVNNTGNHKGVVSWLDLIAEGTQKLACKAFLVSKDTRPTQL